MIENYAKSISFIIDSFVPLVYNYCFLAVPDGFLLHDPNRVIDTALVQLKTIGTPLHLCLSTSPKSLVYLLDFCVEFNIENTPKISISRLMSIFVNAPVLIAYVMILMLDGSKKIKNY